MESSRNSRSSLPGWLFILLTFVIGFFIGLVIFGWWLTPVVWEDGTLEVVNPALQQEFLRASIDSYAYRPNNDLAWARYNAIGSQKDAALAAVAADPRDLNPQDIERYAGAVGASDVLVNPPAAVPTPDPGAFVPQRLVTNPLLIAAGLCLLFSIGGIILVAILLAGSRRSRKSQPEEPANLPPAVAVEEMGSGGGYESFPADTERVVEPLPEDVPAQDPYQTVRIEEESLAEAFEGETPGDLSSTPPRGLDLDTMEPPAEALSDEPLADTDLSDADFAELSALSSEDESHAAAAAAAALFAVHELTEDEEKSSEETGEDEFAWLQAPIEESSDELDWLGAEAGASSGEPSPEEAAPFEMDAPAAIELQDKFGASTDQVIEVDVSETPDDTFSKFSQDIGTLDGIGSDYAQNLKQAGIGAPLLLLRRGATIEGRRTIAQDSGLSEELVLHWVHYADLLRVQGLNHEFAALLQSVGIESIDALAQSEPEPLYERMRAGVAISDRPVRIPSYRSLESWIDQARQLPKTVTE